jgi:myosin-5
MSSAYAKGTQVWLPDTATSWVPGTVSAITLPEDGAASSQVTLEVTYDHAVEGGPEGKTLKFPLSVLQAASDVAATNVHPTTPPPGQDQLPPLRNPPVLESSEDLSSLSNLNEPSGQSASAALWLEARADAGASVTRHRHAICHAPPLHLLWHRPRMPSLLRILVSSLTALLGRFEPFQPAVHL